MWRDKCESNGSVYERCSMGPCANGVVCCNGIGEKKYVEMICCMCVCVCVWREIRVNNL